MALRSLLRFLHVTGLSATPLAGAVPAVAPWRVRSLPQGLTPAAVARLLGSSINAPAAATTPSWSCSCAWGCAPAKRLLWSSMTSTGAVESSW